MEKRKSQWKKKESMEKKNKGEYRLNLMKEGYVYNTFGQDNFQESKLKKEKMRKVDLFINK